MEVKLLEVEMHACFCCPKPWRVAVKLYLVLLICIRYLVVSRNLPILCKKIVINHALGTYHNVYTC